MGGGGGYLALLLLGLLLLLPQRRLSSGEASVGLLQLGEGFLEPALGLGLGSLAGLHEGKKGGRGGEGREKEDLKLLAKGRRLTASRGELLAKLLVLLLLLLLILLLLLTLLKLVDLLLGLPQGALRVAPLGLEPAELHLELLHALLLLDRQLKALLGLNAELPFELGDLGEGH